MFKTNIRITYYKCYVVRIFSYNQITAEKVKKLGGGQIKKSTQIKLYSISVDS